MTVLFALYVCVYLGAPWWLYLVGLACLLLDIRSVVYGEEG